MILSCRTSVEFNVSNATHRVKLCQIKAIKMMSTLEGTKINIISTSDRQNVFGKNNMNVENFKLSNFN